MSGKYSITQLHVHLQLWREKFLSEFPSPFFLSLWFFFLHSSFSFWKPNSKIMIPQSHNMQKYCLLYKNSLHSSSSFQIPDWWNTQLCTLWILNIVKLGRVVQIISCSQVLDEHHDKNQAGKCLSFVTLPHNFSIRSREAGRSSWV